MSYMAITMEKTFWLKKSCLFNLTTVILGFSKVNEILGTFHNENCFCPMIFHKLCDL